MVLPNFLNGTHMDSTGTYFPNSQQSFNASEHVLSNESLISENFNPSLLHSEAPTPQSNIPIPSNQFIPTNLAFQPHFGLNRVTAPYPSHTEQLPGSGYGFQFLNTPIPPFESQDTGSSKRSQKKATVSKSSKHSQTAEAISRTKNRNWSDAEEIALTKAYLYVSVDSIVGRDQSSNSMWSRILKRWQEIMGAYDESRKSNALACHWSVIQAAVNKFHGLWESLERTPRSGTNIGDMKEQAMRMYKETGDGSKFKYEHCWELLRANPKWCSQQLTKTGSTKRQNVGDTFIGNPPPSTPITPEISIRQENDMSYTDAPINEITNIDGCERPVGRKGSKEKRKRMQEEKGIMETLNNFQITIQKEYELREQIMKRDLELKEKSQKLKEEAEERKSKERKRKDQARILNINLEKLQPTYQEALRRRQAQILKEWEEEGLFGDN